MTKTKQILRLSLLCLYVALAATVFYVPHAASAEPAPPAGDDTSFTCPDGTVVHGDATPCPATANCTTNTAGHVTCTPAHTNDTCGDVKTALNYGCKGNGNPIIDIGLAILRFLTVGVGLTLTIMTVYSGIQYVTAQGDPSTTAKVKMRLLAIVISLALYLLSFAFINYLVPGNLFG